MIDGVLKSALLRGPLAKIERAKEHINDLNREITEYLSQRPLKLRVRQDTDPPNRLVYIHAEPAIPDAFGLIVGDAVHNLRTALDHLCYGIAGDKAPRPEGVGFPFVKKPESLGSAIATRQMQVAGEHVINELHALKPYPGGDKYLYAVKVADERDKHHFIITTGQWIEMSMGQLGSLIERDVGSPEARIGYAGDFITLLDWKGPAFDEEADFQPAFAICFGEGEALENETVVPALKEMAVATEAAVRRLADAFFR